MQRNPTKHGRTSLCAVWTEVNWGQCVQIGTQDGRGQSELPWYSTQTAPPGTLTREHLCKCSHFPPGFSALLLECESVLMKFEYFGWRLVVALGLYSISVKFDPSYSLEKEENIPAPERSKWKILCALHSNMCYSHNCWLQTFNPTGLEQTSSIQLKCRYPLCCFPTPIMCFPGCWLHFQPTFLSLITFFLNEWMKCLYHKLGYLGLGFFSFPQNKWW